MTSAQHEIDHLEFPDGTHVNHAVGHSSPPHAWRPVYPGLERCVICQLRRFQLGEETVYQRKTNRSLVAGAEPRCRKKGVRR